MKCGIYTNINKDESLLVTKLLMKKLQEYSIDCYIHFSISKLIQNCKSFNKVSSKLDFIITLGGDGTILRIAKECSKVNVPILGINLGNVGFLTEGKQDDIDEILKSIINNDYVLDKKSLLNVGLNGKNFLALNDVVLTRCNDNKLLLIDVFVKNQLVDRYNCDGYIVSTPTGSTAYSLSAGGSILSPNVKAIALTPINAHSLHSRPIVIGDDEDAIIKLDNSNSRSKIVIDGRTVGYIDPGQKVSISTATHYASFIRMHSSNFYKKLLTKLNKWSNVPIEEEIECLE